MLQVPVISADEEKEDELKARKVEGQIWHLPSSPHGKERNGICRNAYTNLSPNLFWEPVEPLELYNG